jgi:hypothetical protein
MINRLILFVIFTLALSAAAQTTPYAEGYIVGQVNKFSIKGDVWEGELQVGSEAMTFNVSLRKTELAEQIKASLGQAVMVHYTQARGADSPYVVREIEKVEPQAKISACPAKTIAGRTRAGRIVSISRVGIETKAWEIKLKMGASSGDLILTTSVADETLVPCLMSVLSAGRLTNVSIVPKGIDAIEP